MRRIVVPGLVMLTAMFGAPAASAGPAPAAASPRHLLVSVSCKAVKTCVAAGVDVNTNHPTAQVWNGVKWAGSDLKLPAHATLGTLNWVSCAAAKSCVAVGMVGATPFTGNPNAEAPLAETWNGSSWTPSRPPAPSGSHGSQLGGISCPTTKTCVASGLYFLANGNAAGFADVRGAGRWTAYKLPGLASNNYSAVVSNVSCLSAVSCYAVGSYGTGFSPGGTPSNVAFAEHWNGRNWTLTRLPMPAGGHGGWLYAVSCVPSSKTCVATGGRGLGGGKSGTLAETLTAGKWTLKTPFATGNDPALYGVSCVSATNCVAAGGGDTAIALNNAFSDAWNGHSWKFGRLPTPNQGGAGRASAVWSVSCVTPTDCAAVGSAGTTQGLVFGFSGFWNGKSWRLVPLA